MVIVANCNVKWYNGITNMTVNTSEVFQTSACISKVVFSTCAIVLTWITATRMRVQIFKLWSSNTMLYKYKGTSARTATSNRRRTSCKYYWHQLTGFTLVTSIAIRTFAPIGVSTINTCTIVLTWIGHTVVFVHHWMNKNTLIKLID